MKYIEENFKGFNLNIAKTGVKYLHSKLRNYDIAVHFEANCHGTIYYNDILIDIFTLLSSEIKNSQILGLELIKKYISMYNPLIWRYFIFFNSN